MNSSVIIDGPPERLKSEYNRIFSKNALKFLEELHSKFDSSVNQLMLDREQQRINILNGNWKPEFNNKSTALEWCIDEIPIRLQNRKLDLGDVSPANTASFVDSLYVNVQGIQVDFDDGHCPTWKNTILGLYNVTMAVHSTLQGAPVDITKSPILMLRPRAFNMIEHHCLIDGKEVYGPLFDYGILMYHNGKRLSELQIGPFFYLSKIENAKETELWDRIFEWTETRLNIRHGTIKACVLIENILAAYCMEDILYSIRHHTIGLNCGIWDYAASIIAKFGNNENFVIPDRNKYVNMSKSFLSAYQTLLIHVCHKHKALATGGMAARILPPGKLKERQIQQLVEPIKQAKAQEILAGVDGFMVYDMRIVDEIHNMWNTMCSADNQMGKIPDIGHINELSLLDIPKGGVTMDGLRQNVSIALLFIYHWLSGNGVFFYNGAVEDSATAEISRSQLWQWIRFSASIEDQTTHERVTYSLVYNMLDETIIKLRKTMCATAGDQKRLISSKFILLEIITSKYYIDYLTTFLNDNHKFRALHNKSDGLIESKL